MKQSRGGGNLTKLHIATASGYDNTRDDCNKARIELSGGCPLNARKILYVIRHFHWPRVDPYQNVAND